MKLLAALCSAAVASAGIVPAYPGPVHVPALVAHPNGAVVPADEPAVVAARADHLAAKGAIFRAAVPAPIAGPAIAPALGYAGPLAGVPQLVSHPNGAVTPADEPAVVAARADHLAAKGVAFHAAVASGPGPVGPIAPAGPVPHAFGYAGPLAGVPADEPAVVAARADHLAAKGAAFHAAVASGPGLVGPAVPAVPAVAPAPAVPALGYARAPLTGPPALVAHPNGAIVPIDEPDVIAARADHFAAHG